MFEMFDHPVMNIQVSVVYSLTTRLCAHHDPQYIMSRDGVKKDVQTQQGNTPLHLAAINSKEKACKVLLSNGFDIRICNSNGKTAADVAPDESLRSFLTKQLESVKGRGNRQDSYDDEDEV